MSWGAIQVWVVGGLESSFRTSPPLLLNLDLDSLWCNLHFFSAVENLGRGSVSTLRSLALHIWIHHSLEQTWTGSKCARWQQWGMTWEEADVDWELFKKKIKTWMVRQGTPHHRKDPTGCPSRLDTPCATWRGDRYFRCLSRTFCLPSEIAEFRQTVLLWQSESATLSSGSHGVEIMNKRNLRSFQCCDRPLSTVVKKVTSDCVFNHVNNFMCFNLRRKYHRF